MFRNATSALLLFIVLTGSVGCSKYQRVLKSNDFEQKFDMAMTYYDAGKYQKAFPLYEELITVFRGTARAEEVYYYYAYCNYQLGDYMLAGYHFNNFVKTFPRSKRAEDAQFMNAKCYFLDSPEPSLDQSSTITAIDELQLFINRYPNSPKVDECNTLMDRLRFKLETKSYNGAKLYYRLGDFKAAIFALRNTLADYPDTRYREEIEFMIVESAYKLADNSVESKKEKRFEEAIAEAKEYLKKYPRTKNRKEVERVRADSELKLEELNNRSTQVDGL